MELSRQDTSDLFRWLVEQDRIGSGSLSTRLLAEEVDAICSVIENRNAWLDEWREYQALQPKPGIGVQSGLQG